MSDSLSSEQAYHLHNARSHEGEEVQKYHCDPSGMFWLTFATAAVDIYRFAALLGVLLSSYFFLWPLLVRLIILCRLHY